MYVRLLPPVVLGDMGMWHNCVPQLSLCMCVVALCVRCCVVLVLQL